MSGEHGDGRARGALLPLMYSERVIAAFEAVKDVFDPDDVLNPGVIVRPRPFAADLRRPAAKNGDFTTAGAPVHRRRQVHRRHRRRHVPQLPRHPRPAHPFQPRLVAALGATRGNRAGARRTVSRARGS
jgi:hypothetical protein